jgi:hypothetical protein
VRAEAGCGVDYHAAAVGAHVGDLVLHGKEYAGQVHRELAVPGALVHVGQRPGFKDSRVAERDVQAAVAVVSGAILAATRTASGRPRT